MPFILNKTGNSCHLAVWRMEESEDMLSSMLAQNITCSFSSPHRRREFLTLRVMAGKLGINPEDILYRPGGAPYIKGGPYVSFSHTKEYAAILLSKDNPHIGVDVEMLSDRFLKVESRYLHPTESRMLREELPHGMSIEKALGIWWNAKEALYKAAGEQHIRFTEDFKIYGLKCGLMQDNDPTIEFSGQLSTSYRDTVYHLIYEVRNDFSLACCYAE